MRTFVFFLFVLSSCDESNTSGPAQILPEETHPEAEEPDSVISKEAIFIAAK